jgi:hypothetical protein
MTLTDGRVMTVVVGRGHGRGLSFLFVLEGERETPSVDWTGETCLGSEPNYRLYFLKRGCLYGVQLKVELETVS